MPLAGFSCWCCCCPLWMALEDLFKLIQVSWRSTTTTTYSNSTTGKERRHQQPRIWFRVCHIGILFYRSAATVMLWLGGGWRNTRRTRQVKGWLPFHINFITIVLRSTTPTLPLRHRIEFTQSHGVRVATFRRPHTGETNDSRRWALKNAKIIESRECAERERWTHNVKFNGKDVRLWSESHLH